ncbi:MAG TPA: amidohydrolase [Flavobacterium sp.]|nr:amidohydrolase [Flavobacterium sp.]
MKTAIIQSSLIWENAQANRTHFAEKIASMATKADLIVLPEMFSTGFTMNPSPVAETMDGETISWMKSTAEKTGSAICGSVVIIENDNYRNRFLFAFPSGEIQFYDKRHLFALTGENTAYTSGEKKVIIEYKDWKICPQVCYDLRFPVFSRNTEGYDLLIYSANWPAARINAWDALLKARAIENMSYVIGVNRIGDDKNDYHYPGHSQILDCFGNYKIMPSENEGIFIADLDKNAMLEARQKFGFLNDRDQFTVI